MVVKTDCGHQFAVSWTMDDLVVRFDFACPECGDFQVIPPENILSDEQASSVNADMWYQENGYTVRRV